jgi:hypothetical protein
MITEAPEAADFGGTGRRIPASSPRRHGRLRTRRDLESLGNSARVPRRHRNRGVDSHHAASVRETAETVRAKLRAIVGIVGLFALMAVGTAAIGAGATEQHRGVDRFAYASGGSDPDVGARVVGSARDQTPRSGSAPSTPAPGLVDLFGDSLGYQAEPYLDMFFAQTHNYTVSKYTYGGTARCDSHRVDYPR